MNENNDKSKSVSANLPERKFIVSCSVDFYGSLASNYSELYGMLFDEIRLHGIEGIKGIINDLVSFIVEDFKFSDHYDSDTFFEDYFLSRNLVVPPSYKEQIHRVKGYYPIIKIILWVTYPTDISFEKLYDHLYMLFSTSYTSNASVVPIDPREYEYKGKLPSVWTQYIDGKME